MPFISYISLVGIFIYVFLFGAFGGWIIELFYRTLIAEHKLVNPGFLSGPYLPLYGFGAVFLFFASGLEMPLYFRAPFFLVAITALEYITGLFFLRVFNLRLWDYRNVFLNYKGLICPLFSVYWTILSMLFFYFVYPFLSGTYIQFSRFDGFFYLFGVFSGFIIEDIFISFRLANKLKKIIGELKIREESEQGTGTAHLNFIDLKSFKLQLRKRAVEIRKKYRFFRYFNPFSFYKNNDLWEQIEFYFESVRKRHENLKTRKHDPKGGDKE